MDQHAKSHWIKLSVEDRLKLLREYCFWDGFSNYKYDYLPDTLKTIILVKIDCSELKRK